VAGADPRVQVAVIGPLLDEATGTQRRRLEEAGATVVVGPGDTEEAVVATAAGAEVLASFGQWPAGAGVLEALPRLRFLMQCAVGYDRVDLDAATRLGILVANSPSFCVEEVSDSAAMLILACARRLPRQLHAGRAHGWARGPAVAAMGDVARLRGQTVGFVAFGKIARLTAEKLAGFGLRYLAYDPHLTPGQVARWGVELVNLDELCRRSDVVTMHAPLAPATRRMFGEPQLKAMKPTASFVNTARGGTVDEAALARALREGWIAGAGLDVLEQEPPAPGNPLLDHPGVLWTAHTAGHGAGSLADNRQHSVDEILRVLAGAWPVALLNPEAREGAERRGWPLRPVGAAGGR
jgi:D-3-phosphoglycerate dehydrogenase